MLNTPKSLRLQIAILGRTNVGKSSLLNLIIEQKISIVSPISGTTTDVVEKAQELPPLGPVLWLDTAGFDDVSALSAERVQATMRVLERADMALLVCKGDEITESDCKIMAELEQRKIPYIKIYNQTDKYAVKATDGICVTATNDSAREVFMQELKARILALCPEDFLNTQPLLSDLLEPHQTVIMIVPLDYEAPKGRLILPQVMAIRDCLDHGQNIMVVKEDEYAAALQNFKTPPALVVCDSQVVDKMVAETPENIPCTTFSILMARYKSDLYKMVQGAAKLWHLQDGDKVLIAESCTHHAADDDIGRVKIPRLITQKTGKNLQFDVISGCNFAADLSAYKLVVQCGGCTINRRQMLFRLQQCEKAGVAITNYGVCISELKGVLERALSPFPKVLSTYLDAKEKRS